MKQISLSRGLVALVDDKDFKYLGDHNWYIHDTGWGGLYAARKENGRKLFMHRIIMRPPEGMVIDHINGNRLDNRRRNLRVCTVAENNRNRSASRRNKSGYKGVRRETRGKGFSAGITFDHTYYYLGYYPTAQEAHEAYKKAALELHGEFAHF